MPKTNKLTGFSFNGLMQVGCFFVLLFSIAPVLQPFYWRLELLVHFRLQYFILSIIFLIYFILFKNKPYSIIALCVFLINLTFIIPQYIKNQKPLGGVKTSKLKLFHSNVLSSNTLHTKLIDQISQENPDIILLQEVDNSWVNSLSVIKSTYSHVIERPRSDNFGIALYSNMPILDYQIHAITHFELPTIEAKIKTGNSFFYLIGTHPPPPVNKQYYDNRNTQISFIAQTARKIKGAKIVLGDFNTTIWSDDYTAFESETGLFNASKGFGIIPTWPTNLIPFMIPIDHCLVSNHFNVKTIKSGQPIGSDHLPLVIELEF